MRNQTLITSVLTVSALTAVAQADLVNFYYVGSASNPSLYATGYINVTGINAVSGSITISGAGAMDGDYALLPGAGSNSSFIWDNVFDMGTATKLTTTGGLEFMNDMGSEINMWANNPTSYSLYGHLAGNGAGTYTPADDGGSFGFSPGAAPAPGALALSGLAGLVGWNRRRR